MTYDKSIQRLDLFSEFVLGFYCKHQVLGIKFPIDTKKFFSLNRMLVWLILVFNLGCMV